MEHDRVRLEVNGVDEEPVTAERTHFYLSQETRRRADFERGSRLRAARLQLFRELLQLARQVVFFGGQRYGGAVKGLSRAISGDGAPRQPPLHVIAFERESFQVLGGRVHRLQSRRAHFRFADAVTSLHFDICHCSHICDVSLERTLRGQCRFVHFYLLTFQNTLGVCLCDRYVPRESHKKSSLSIEK